MQIDIAARHGHLDSALQERITEKVSKLPRLWDRITAIEVTVDLEHFDAPGVELRACVERANDCIAAEQASTVLAALDGALHKLEQQLRRYKEKIQHHKGDISHGGTSPMPADLPEPPAPARREDSDLS